jgi:hypothetical protein
VMHTGGTTHVVRRREESDHPRCEDRLERAGEKETAEGSKKDRPQQCFW